MIDKVIEFARERGYQGVKIGKIWNGYQVYEPYFGTRGISYVGYPLVILAKGDELRMSTEKESIEYLNFSQPVEDDDI